MVVRMQAVGFDPESLDSPAGLHEKTMLRQEGVFMGPHWQSGRLARILTICSARRREKRSLDGPSCFPIRPNKTIQSEKEHQSPSFLNTTALNPNPQALGLAKARATRNSRARAPRSPSQGLHAVPAGRSYAKVRLQRDGIAPTSDVRGAGWLFFEASLFSW